MRDCRQCRYLKAEEWPRNKTAMRCLKPLPEPWGNGRAVLLRPTGKERELRIEPPKWCGDSEEPGVRSQGSYGKMQKRLSGKA